MKMTRLIRRLISTVILLSIVAFVFSLPILVSGYELYKEVLELNPLDLRIEQLRSDPDYVVADEISPIFLAKVIESEDRRFYEHLGINLTSTIRAFLKNVEAGAKVEGGSSITQQLAKNMYFSFEKKYERKVAELLVAFDLERSLEKTEILELYCNIAYFGEGTVGIGEATRHYYGIEPFEMDEDQAETLVKTLKSPSVINPNTVNN